MNDIITDIMLILFTDFAVSPLIILSTLNILMLIEIIKKQWYRFKKAMTLLQVTNKFKVLELYLVLLWDVLSEEISLPVTPLYILMALLILFIVMELTKPSKLKNTTIILYSIIFNTISVVIAVSICIESPHHFISICFYFSHAFFLTLYTIIRVYYICKKK